VILFKVLRASKRFLQIADHIRIKLLQKTHDNPIYRELYKIEQPLPDMTKKNDAGTIQASFLYVSLCSQLYMNESNSYAYSQTFRITQKPRQQDLVTGGATQSPACLKVII
jgi:hypothetical protein